MKDFLEKYRTDSKYKALVQLIGFGVFILFVVIYASIVGRATPATPIENLISGDKTETKIDYINIPEKYEYVAKIEIDDNIYEYSGRKDNSEKTIVKNVSGTITNYVYKDNEYYVLEDGMYIKTNKDDVYDVISYNYLNLDTINSYLNKAVKSNNQYSVYIKDVILGSESEDYFVITITDGRINIDYRPLMKLFNNNISKYNVNIEINEIE